MVNPQHLMVKVKPWRLDYNILEKMVNPQLLWTPGDPPLVHKL